MPTNHLEAESSNDVIELKSTRAARKSDDIVARSVTALDRLHAARDVVDPAEIQPNSDASQATIEPSPNTKRKHVIIVNSDPKFLDAARVVLQDGRYNVTTTNLVPLTYQMVASLGASVLVIDLMIDQPQIWVLAEQLRLGDKTRMLPIVFMSTNPQLLEKAERLPWRSGGRYVFVKPFSTVDSVDVIHSLVGSA